MEEILKYVKPELLVAIPVLYFIGWALKLSKLKDNYIPLVLGGAGIALSLIWVLSTSPLTSWQNILLAIFTAIMQGVLVAGCAVFCNQIYKQATKAKSENSEEKK